MLKLSSLGSSKPPPSSTSSSLASYLLLSQILLVGHTEGTVVKYMKTRSTQRAQTSLAEADHYSHMPTVKMLSLGGERLTTLKKKKKKKKKFWIITCTTIWLCYHYDSIFSHLLILEYSDHHQNLISSSLYYPVPFHRISLQSVYNFLSDVVHRQTDRQTDKPTLPTT